MKNRVAAVIELLASADSLRVEGLWKVCNCLAVDPASSLGRFVAAKSDCFTSEPIRKLVAEVATIVEGRNAASSIVDWPFEHFWGNPYEPRHSKMLRYFIDPDEDHKCGPTLLQKFLDVISQTLKSKRAFSIRNCRVSCRDYIDILIERDGDYAIIIENKVNDAKDQERQLERYVQSVKGDYQSEQVYVFYLPLSDSKEPNANDLEAILKLDVTYAAITFEKHVLEWLDAVLESSSESDRRQGLPEGMRANLSHYRNLICFLIKKERTRKIDMKVIEQLKLADEADALPALSDVKTLKEAAIELQRCLEFTLRGKLLTEVHKVLQKDCSDVWFSFDEEQLQKVSFDSPFDESFEKAVMVCVRVNEAVTICFGGAREETSGDGDIFWLGYRRTASDSKEKVYSEVVSKQATNYFKDLHSDTYWYAWDWIRNVDYRNCTEKVIAKEVAGKIVEMKSQFVDGLKSLVTS